MFSCAACFRIFPVRVSFVIFFLLTLVSASHASNSSSCILCFYCERMRESGFTRCSCQLETLLWRSPKTKLKSVNDHAIIILRRSIIYYCNFASYQAGLLGVFFFFLARTKTSSSRHTPHQLTTVLCTKGPAGRNPT